MRTANINRTTAETAIQITLNTDGTGVSSIDSGCPFLDHMLTLFARHGLFDLSVTCRGDTEVDYHHTVEDIGIALGEAFRASLGEKRGICRYGDVTLPMDEALILCAVDLSGRAHLSWDVTLPSPRVGDFDTELGEEFFLGFTRAAACTLHIRQLAGRNTHHILEGIFKASARALRRACERDARAADAVPSTKGVL